MQRHIFFQLSPTETVATVYSTNTFGEARTVAKWMRERTDASDCLLVIGSEPEIYFYARRKAATGYMYTYPLMEPHPMREQMLREFVAESVIANPKAIAVCRQSSYDEPIYDSLFAAITLDRTYRLFASGYNGADGVLRFVHDDTLPRVPEDRIMWELYSR